jgi:hypothetical protein
VRPVDTILYRFRRAAAVPTTAGDELARELAPVFAALDAIEEDGEKLRAETAHAVEKRLAGARAEAARIGAQAREAAAAARARTEAEARRTASRESEELLAAAADEGRRRAEAGSARIPKVVQDVVACVKGGPP